MDVNKIIERYDNLLGKKSNIRNVWRDVDKYCIPSNGNFSDPADVNAIYDDTIYRATNILVSGLYSYLTSPASRWFVISDFNGYSNDITDKVLGMLQISNFYQEIYKFYKDIVHYGISCIYNEAVNGYINYKTISPKSFTFEEGEFGIPNTVMVELGYSVNEMVDKFGLKNLSSESQKKFESGKNDKVKILFVVEKNYNTKIKSNYVSYWIEKEQHHLIKTGIYNTMPFFVGVWEEDSSNKYGSSPVINALPSVILANRLSKNMWLNHEKHNNPPLDVPYDGYEGDLDLTPGAINYRTTSNPNDRIEPIITTGNVNLSMSDLQIVQNSINERMFVDLFLMGQERTMTATEVIQRTQEKMLMLGSVIGRLLHNVLQPLIYRTVYLMIDIGILDDSVNDYNEIEFISPLAQSQKSSEYQGLTMLLNTALTISQVNPEVNDNINWDVFIKKVGQLYSVDSSLFKDDKTVSEIRQQRQQMQQIQSQLQLEELSGKAQKQKAQANVNMAKAQKIQMGV